MHVVSIGKDPVGREVFTAAPSANDPIAHGLKASFAVAYDKESAEASKFEGAGWDGATAADWMAEANRAKPVDGFSPCPGWLCALVLDDPTSSHEARIAAKAGFDRDCLEPEVALECGYTSMKDKLVMTEGLQKVAKCKELRCTNKSNWLSKHFRYNKEGAAMLDADNLTDIVNRIKKKWPLVAEEYRRRHGVELMAETNAVKFKRRKKGDPGKDELLAGRMADVVLSLMSETTFASDRHELSKALDSLFPYRATESQSRGVMKLSVATVAMMNLGNKRLKETAPKGGLVVVFRDEDRMAEARAKFDGLVRILSGPHELCEGSDKRPVAWLTTADEFRAKWDQSMLKHAIVYWEVIGEVANGRHCEYYGSSGGDPLFMDDKPGDVYKANPRWAHKPDRSIPVGAVHVNSGSAVLWRASGTLPYLKQLLTTGAGVWTNNHASCVVLSSCSSYISNKTLMYCHGQGLTNCTGAVWCKVFKDIDSNSKKLRKAAGVNELLSAPAYAQAGYLAVLASKEHFNIDVDSEKKGRGEIKTEHLGYDAGKGLFTTARGLEINAAVHDKIHLGWRRSSASRILPAFMFWLSRQNWATSGSASGAAATYSPEIAKDGETAEDAARKVTRMWVDKAKAYADSDGASSWASMAGVVDPIMSEYGGTNKDKVSLSKRGALERMLWESIKVVLSGKPKLLSAAAEKHEDGKARLLLSSDTFHYVIYSMVLYGIEPHLADDPRMDFPAGPAVEWARMQLRVRFGSSGVILRLWDFADFNAQHTNLGMFGDLLATANMFSDIAGERMSEEEVQRIYASHKYVAYSFLNTWIRWEPGDITKSESGLSSGVRGTTYGNNVKNPSYSTLARTAMRDIYGMDPVFYELDKGDDQYGAVTDWLSAVWLNRMMRWVGCDGQDTKVLAGRGWAEYLRCLYDGEGAVCGCVNRSIAVLIVSSWQNAPTSDGLRVNAEISGILDLLVRRSAMMDWACAVANAVWPFWGRLSVTKKRTNEERSRFADGQERDDDADKKWIRMSSNWLVMPRELNCGDATHYNRGCDWARCVVTPSAWILASKLVGGDTDRTHALAQRISCIGLPAEASIDELMRPIIDYHSNNVGVSELGSSSNPEHAELYKLCKRSRLTDDALMLVRDWSSGAQTACPCGGKWCGITFSLPNAPEQLQPVSVRSVVMKSMGSESSKDWNQWGHMISTHWRKTSPSEQAAVVQSAQAENYGPSIHKSEASHVYKRNDLRRVAWQCTVRQWDEWCGILMQLHAGDECAYADNKDATLAKLLQARQRWLTKMEEFPELPSALSKDQRVEAEKQAKQMVDEKTSHRMALAVMKILGLGGWWMRDIPGNCPVCEKRHSVIAAATTAVNMVWGRRYVIEVEVKQALLKGLRSGPFYVREQATSHWHCSFGVGSNSRLGRTDAMLALIYADYYTAVSPPPRDADSAPSDWLRGRVFDVGRELLSEKSLLKWSTAVIGWSHAAASDWFWGTILMSRRPIAGLGTLASNALMNLVLYITEKMMPVLALKHASGGAHVLTRLHLQSLFDTVKLIAMTMAQQDDLWLRTAGD
jgi:hypothetical protein